MKRFLFLSLLFPITVCAGEIGDNIEYVGYFKTEVWTKVYNDESHFSLSSFKNTVDLAMEYTFNNEWALFFHPRYFYDAAYDIRTDFNSNFDRNQEKMGNTQRTEWLRDCYLDYTSDNLDLRLGKQQVVWGQADGVPFLDRVMPFELTNIFLPDFADIRIPLWMVKAEYSPWVNSTLQFLLIPDFEASRAAPAHAPFAFSSLNAFDDFKTLMSSVGGNVVETIYRPSKEFENSRVGLRWRSMVGNLEYTLNWLYGYTTSAYTYSEGLTNITGVLPNGTPIGTYAFSRRHKLVHLVGASFNKAIVDPGLFEGLTLRGEFVYIHDEPTYYGTQGSRQATEPSDKYNYVLGFDKTFLTDLMCSLQFGQMITAREKFNGYQVLNGMTYGVADEVENFLSLKISKDFMHERIKPEMLIVYNDDGDGRVTSKVKFEAQENLWFTLAYHHFWGNPWTSNGQFRNDDHIVTEVKYTF